MKEIMDKLYQMQNLEEAEMEAAAEELFAGRMGEIQLSAFLIAEKLKGETADELAGFAKIMQANAVKIPAVNGHVMDNCGTGGDGMQSFNISTTSAFVLAAGGVKVAKHGNRSISSRSGSADIFELLGIPLAATPEEIADLLNQCGIAFLFAPHMHPKMKYAMGVRSALKTPTLFNLIGPLTNPVSLTHQLMGTYRRDLLTTTAETLGKLGRKRAVVVNGHGQMDEANLAGATHLAIFENGTVTEKVLQPEELGFKRYSIDAIRGGTPTDNCEILLDVLKNAATPQTETIKLNAGIGFYAGGAVDTIARGITLAEEILASGAAYDKLRELQRMTQEVAS